MRSVIAIPNGEPRLGGTTGRAAMVRACFGLPLIILVSLGIVAMGAYGAATLTASDSGISTTTFQRFVDGEFLLKFKPGTSAEEVQTVHAATKASEIGQIYGIGVTRVKVPAGSSVGEMVAWYRRDPRVLYAEANYVFQEGNAADVAAGIVRSADTGAATLNLTGETPGKTVEEAVDYARLKGTAVLVGERGLTPNPIQR